jgi:hypothetical protein
MKPVSLSNLMEKFISVAYPDKCCVVVYAIDNPDYYEAIDNPDYCEAIKMNDYVQQQIRQLCPDIPEYHDPTEKNIAVKDFLINGHFIFVCDTEKEAWEIFNLFPEEIAPYTILFEQGTVVNENT